jgi:hypothetical protein
MPSSKQKKTHQSSPKKPSPKESRPDNNKIHLGFFPFLTLVLVSWVLYRSFFEFPVWFDETVGKAVFFGLPVWLYVTMSGSTSIPDSFSGYKLKNGLLLGIAVGGVLGFVTSLIALLQRGGVVEAVWLFSSEIFWKEFTLALLTGFWETLIFFSLVQTVIQEKFYKWTVLQQVFLTATIFTVFHLPNILLRFEPYQIIGQILLMLLFSLGQGYLFAARRNAFALVLSHAIWGMVLLIHFW